MIVNGSAYVIPEFGCLLPFVEHNRQRFCEELGRVSAEGSARGCIDIHSPDTGTELNSRRGFADCLRAIDEDCADRLHARSKLLLNNA